MIKGILLSDTQLKPMGLMHACTCIPLLELATWPHSGEGGGEPAGGNKTGGPVGSGDTSLISPVAWSPQCSRGTHLWAYKAYEMMNPHRHG